MRDQVKQARASLRQFIPIIPYELLTKLRQCWSFRCDVPKIDAQLPKFSISALGSAGCRRYKRYNQANMLRTQPRQNESGQSGDRGGKFSYRVVPVKYLKQIGFLLDSESRCGRAGAFIDGKFTQRLS